MQSGYSMNFDRAIDFADIFVGKPRQASAAVVAWRCR
jgi:hypothetical protein